MTPESYQLARRQFWCDMYRYYISVGNTRMNAGTLATQDLAEFDQRWEIQY